MIKYDILRTRPRYCRINLSVPVLDRFFSQEDPPDFRLSRESLAVQNLLNQERRHGWWPFATRSSSSRRPRSTWKKCPAVGLARHRAFIKAAGAIDGCHIRIKPPSGPDGQCYRNRKLFPSIILQAVCDHQGRFIDTYVGWPGSVHDSRVLRHSPLYAQSSYPPPGHFILADGGYPCLQRPLPLITPYKRQVQGVGAQRFNSHHSRARSIIEGGFGMMKTRFRSIFLQALEVHYTFVPHVVTACTILHNIWLSAGDVLAPEDEPEDDVEEDEGEADMEAVNGARWGDQLCAEVSALEVVPPGHDYL
ncbi:putative nuclease HARBI1 [Cyprinus carpio]|uniref:Nuclease HARBI1 n=1 Tax=Cyprinus carpio TaxID=7962 RepID=A0A9R0AT22_CYPCA|nr:putative nuclease HARBI1 [Cyprinus carpio]